MADNVLYTQGAGTTLATDDVATVHYPIFKLNVGGPDASVFPSNSIPVFIASGISFHPTSWHVSTEYTSQQTDTEVKAAPGTGLSLYLTDITIIASGTVITTLEQGTSTLKYKHYSGGQGDGVAKTFTTPIKFAADTSLTVTTSAAAVIFLNVCGYIAA